VKKRIESHEKEIEKKFPKVKREFYSREKTEFLNILELG
jgi:hypothetical protein